MKKKVIKFLFINILLVIGVFVRAESISHQLVGNDQVSPGTMLDLNLILNTDKTIYGYKVDVSYEDNVFTLNSVNNFKPFVGKHNLKKKTFIFRTNGSVGKLQIANLKFFVNQETNSKSANIKVTGLVCMTDTKEETDEDFCKDGEVRQAEEFVKSLAIKSNVNDLEYIEINGQKLSNFNKNDLNYEMLVETDVDEVEINAKAVDLKATVDGTGKKKLNYGDNKILITVVSESGASKTYTIKITRKDDRKSDNYLKQIIVNGEKIEDFEQNILSYKIYTYKKAKLDDIKIDAITNDSQATYSVKKPDKLIIGENIFKIIVKSEKGEENTYTLRIHNIDKEISKKLEILSLNGYKFDFDRNTNKYELYYEKAKIKNLKVRYKTQEKDDYVDVVINPDVNNLDDPSKVLKENDKILITIKGIDGEKEEYEIIFKKDKRLNFYGFLIFLIFLILLIILLRIIKKKKDKELHDGAKHSSEGRKDKLVVEEIKEESEDEEESLDHDLEATKELSDEELSRLRR